MSMEPPHCSFDIFTYLLKRGLTNNSLSKRELKDTLNRRGFNMVNMYTLIMPLDIRVCQQLPLLLSLLSPFR